jgi:hypothetical protein
MNNRFESFNNKSTSEILDPQIKLEQETLLFQAYEILFRDVVTEGEKLKRDFLNAPTTDEAIHNPELMDQSGDGQEDINKKLKEHITESKRLKERLKQLVAEIDKLDSLIPDNPQDN